MVRYKPLSADNDSAFKTERSLDTIVFAGSYSVEITHNGIDVGLPIEDCGEEHYIVGTLVVTDSGTSGSKQKNRVIGQVLSMTSRNFKETKVYTRTLIDGKWNMWRSLMNSGMYEKISSTEELVATVEALATETKTMQNDFAHGIERVKDIESTLQTIVVGEDIIKEYYVDFAGLYQWQALPAAIKAGSMIEISGANTKLNFYESRNSSPNLIDTKGRTKSEYTYVRNLDIVGNFTIKITEKSKIGELEENVEIIGNKTEALEGEFVQAKYKDFTLYPVGENLFYHSTHEDYSGLDDYTYITSEYYVGVQGGKTVFLSGNSVKMSIHEYDSAYVQIKTQSLSANTSFTLSDNCAFIKWSVAVYDLKYNRTKIMVNYGVEALTYSVFVNSLTFELSDNIEEVRDVISAINTKVDGGDFVTEQVLNFSQSYQSKQPLLIPVKRGSIIEINGAGTSLNFYEEGSTIANSIDEKNNVAVADFTHVRNLTTIGEFTIKVTEKSKVGVLEENIEEVRDVISAINTKVDGGDIITESSYTLSTSDYQWQALNSPIKAGSLIEISGASTVLAFYEERSSTTSQHIHGSGIAATNLTWFRNQGVKGDYIIKVTEKSKVGVLEENMKTLENNIAELSKAKLILTEPVVLSSTSEHCLYLDDAIEGNAVGRKYGLIGTQFASYGSVAYVNKPATGSKKGVFYAPSAVDNVNDEITVKSVAPAPREINILDIGSSYIDIGTITERQCYNYTRDGYTVNIIGTMGAEGKRHEARSGGTWDFLVKPLGRAVILDVSGVENLPITGYPGTTYQDANGVKWTVRGVMITGGAGKLVLSSFSVDANYGSEGATGSTDYDTAAANMPLAGTLNKTTNDSTGTETPGGDDSIQYTAKELVYYNPFWNPATNELDFAYYINKWGFATPDIITLTFGSNDLGNFEEASQDAVDAVVEKAVSVVNKIHEQLPTCKVLLTCSCYGYKGVGENNFREVYRIKNIQKYYKTLIGVMGQSTEYADYVRVVPTMCMIDRENGYSVSDKTLHSSYPAVKYARDIVHPNTAGFNQFADAMLGYAYDLL